MSKYIDADKLTEQFNSLEQLARKRVYDTPTNSPAYERYATQYYERERALSIIKAQPTADVVEVVHGKWNTTDTILGRCCVCSVCGSCPTMEYKYCPYCGAKMDGERRSENEG